MRIGKSTLALLVAGGLAAGCGDEKGGAVSERLRSFVPPPSSVEYMDPLVEKAAEQFGEGYRQLAGTQWESVYGGINRTFTFETDGNVMYHEYALSELEKVQKLRRGPVPMGVNSFKIGSVGKFGDEINFNFSAGIHFPRGSRKNWDYKDRLEWRNDGLSMRVLLDNGALAVSHGRDPYIKSQGVDVAPYKKVEHGLGADYEALAGTQWECRSTTNDIGGIVNFTEYGEMIFDGVKKDPIKGSRFKNVIKMDNFSFSDNSFAFDMVHQDVYVPRVFLERYVIKTDSNNVSIKFDFSERGLIRSLSSKYNGIECWAEEEEFIYRPLTGRWSVGASGSKEMRRKLSDLKQRVGKGDDFSRVKGAWSREEMYGGRNVYKVIFGEKDITCIEEHPSTGKQQVSFNIEFPVFLDAGNYYFHANGNVTRGGESRFMRNQFDVRRTGESSVEIKSYREDNWDGRKTRGDWRKYQKSD